MSVKLNPAEIRRIIDSRWEGRRWHSFRWFNLSPGSIRVLGKPVRFWNVFNRHCKGGERFWGVGLLQIGNRHLFFLGHFKYYDGSEHTSFCLFFLGRTK